MKKAIRVFVCCIFFFVLITCVGCSRRCSWSHASGGFLAKTKTCEAAFESRLATWLATQGFQPTTPPPSVSASLNSYRDRRTVSCYSGRYCNSAIFYFRVDKVPQPGIGEGWTAFHFGQVWQVTGSSEYVVEMESLSQEFASRFEKWLGEQELPDGVASPERFAAPDAPQ